MTTIEPGDSPDDLVAERPNSARTFDSPDLDSFCGGSHDAGTDALFPAILAEERRRPVS
ncbi:MAG: hypothetical protein QF796_03950 [Acidimicrobiales bacterium]|jgi:hypothetical protein|nr:hypothetical protein [Acidimicrobiales bacterium]MDP6759969.1 hypothetical protein [Acidimicrobiales bacterium]|tara:strand:- start:842 stop:1018 length:177 start_codon:yes stop_codon:yes gene_type:complete